MTRCRLKSFSLASAIALLIFCSNNSSDIAGGSGAGNPGAYIVVSMVVDTLLQPDSLTTVPTDEPVLSKKISENRFMGGPGFLIYDDDGMPITIDTACIQIQRLHFTVPKNEELDSIVKNNYPYLSVDSQSIIIDKNVTFELVSGATYPSLCSLILPALNYTGIIVESISEGAKKSGPNPLQTGFNVIFVGKFLYLNEIRNLTICLNLDTAFYFPNTNKESIFSNNDTTYCQITLNVSTWFNGINLQGCIESGTIPLEQNGDLVITAPPKGGSCKGAINSIRNNIISNGALKVSNKNRNGLN